MSARVESRTIMVRGQRTQLLVGGEGPPLVYLHSAAGETEWMRYHSLLAEHFRVYLPAHPGFAGSEGLDAIRDIHDVAWHYVDLFAELGLSNVPVVGLSLGAWIALELAILRPELPSKLVLVDAAGLHVPGAPMAELFIDDLARLRRLLFHEANDATADEIMPASLDDPKILLWLRAREATARVGWNPYLHNPRLPNHLHRVRQETLVLWGREDAVIPLAHGEFYAKHLPNARLEVFAQCGHMLPFEKTERFVATVRSFC
jgi:pimeloyl-ACP methyl ester carboxylesterase